MFSVMHNNVIVSKQPFSSHCFIKKIHYCLLLIHAAIVSAAISTVPLANRGTVEGSPSRTRISWTYSRKEVVSRPPSPPFPAPTPVIKVRSFGSSVPSEELAMRFKIKRTAARATGNDMVVRSNSEHESSVSSLRMIPRRTASAKTASTRSRSRGSSFPDMAAKALPTKQTIRRSKRGEKILP